MATTTIKPAMTNQIVFTCICPSLVNDVAAGCCPASRSILASRLQMQCLDQGQPPTLHESPQTKQLQHCPFTKRNTNPPCRESLALYPGRLFRIDCGYFRCLRCIARSDRLISACAHSAFPPAASGNILLRCSPAAASISATSSNTAALPQRA